MAKIDDLIPSAKEIQKQAALKEAQRADEWGTSKSARVSASTERRTLSLQ